MSVNTKMKSIFEYLRNVSGKRVASTDILIAKGTGCHNSNFKRGPAYWRTRKSPTNNKGAFEGS